MDLKRISKPVLLLNEQICRENIERMASKAAAEGLLFRPHFKTHQSIEIGKWFRESGVKRITVSSLTMCRHFMTDGWDDITVAFPANPREVEDFSRVGGSINLNVLFSDYEQLVAFAKGFDSSAGVFIKIDTGYRRSGIDWNHYPDILRICDYLNLNNHLRIKGLLTHSGHTYSVKGVNNVIDIYCDTLHKLLHTKEITPADNLLLSIGDTPSCSIVKDFSGIDEIRPGNFVFYDLMQAEIGSCSECNIAVALAAPVVSLNRNRGEAVVYGGAIHLSKEFITDSAGRRIFGKAFRLHPEGWDINDSLGNIVSVSQEHGILVPDEENSIRIKPGDLVAILPVHSCLASDLMKGYHTISGDSINDVCGK
ncbi:MAG: alanine racemase [Bacteroidetes bacterium]|nr:alanine racemase [Bacteroidota bacterium]